MGPAQAPRAFAGAAAARDPLSPPPFNGKQDSLQWARRVARWERAHDVLCEKKHKQGLPKYIRGYLLAEVLTGTAYRTVTSTLTEEEITAENGVKAILDLLVKFNPTSHAYDVFSSFKSLMQIRRGQNESFKFYVNRFEAAASELRNLTSQTTGAESEQFIAFQLLEGAHVPTAVFLQVLANCVGTSVKDAETENTEGDKAVVLELQELSKALETATGDEFVTQLPGLKDDDAAQTATMYAQKMKQLGDKLGKLAQKLDAQSSKETTKAKISSIEAYGSIVIDFEAAKKSLLGLDAVSLEPSANQNRMDTHRRFPPNMARNTFLTQNITYKANSRSYNHTGAKSYKDRIAEKNARTNWKVCGKTIGLKMLSELIVAEHKAEQ